MGNSLSFSASGSFDKTDKFLQSLAKGEALRKLDAYGKEGVAALAAATPVESGETRNLWSYKVEYKNGQGSITWFNSHVEKGVPIAIILQYGHGTGTGGFVAGRDYINPAMKPVFDKIADKVWKAVISA